MSRTEATVAGLMLLIWASGAVAMREATPAELAAIRGGRVMNGMRCAVTNGLCYLPQDCQPTGARICYKVKDGQPVVGSEVPMVVQTPPGWPKADDEEALEHLFGDPGPGCHWECGDGTAAVKRIGVGGMRKACEKDTEESRCELPENWRGVKCATLLIYTEGCGGPTGTATHVYAYGCE